MFGHGSQGQCFIIKFGLCFILCFFAKGQCQSHKIVNAYYLSSLLNVNRLICFSENNAQLEIFFRSEFNYLAYYLQFNIFKEIAKYRD